MLKCSTTENVCHFLSVLQRALHFESWLRSLISNAFRSGQRSWARQDTDFGARCGKLHIPWAFWENICRQSRLGSAPEKWRAGGKVSSVTRLYHCEGKAGTTILSATVFTAIRFFLSSVLHDRVTTRKCVLQAFPPLAFRASERREVVWVSQRQEGQIKCTAMAKLKEKESLSCSAKVPGSPIKVLLGISIGTAMHNSDRSPFFCYWSFSWLSVFTGLPANGGVPSSATLSRNSVWQQ